MATSSSVAGPARWRSTGRHPLWTPPTSCATAPAAQAAARPSHLVRISNAPVEEHTSCAGPHRAVTADDAAVLTELLRADCEAVAEGRFPRGTSRGAASAHARAATTPCSTGSADGAPCRPSRAAANVARGGIRDVLPTLCIARPAAPPPGYPPAHPCIRTCQQPPPIRKSTAGASRSPSGLLLLWHSIADCDQLVTTALDKHYNAIHVCIQANIDFCAQATIHDCFPDSKTA